METGETKAAEPTSRYPKRKRRRLHETSSLMSEPPSSILQNPALKSLLFSTISRRHEKDGSVVGSEGRAVNQTKLCDKNWIAAVAKQLTKKAYLYKDIGTSTPCVYPTVLTDIPYWLSGCFGTGSAATRMSPVHHYEELLYHNIIEVDELFEDYPDSCPSVLIPYYDFWQSRFDASVWTIDALEDFMVRYFFHYPSMTAALETATENKGFRKYLKATGRSKLPVANKRKRRTSQRRAKTKAEAPEVQHKEEAPYPGKFNLEKLFGALYFGVKGGRVDVDLWKRNFLLMEPISKRLPAVVKTFLAKKRLLLEELTPSDRKAMEVHDQFKQAFKKHYPSAELRACFHAPNQLRFSITKKHPFRSDTCSVEGILMGLVQQIVQQEQEARLRNGGKKTGSTQRDRFDVADLKMPCSVLDAIKLGSLDELIKQYSFSIFLDGERFAVQARRQALHLVPKRETRVFQVTSEDIADVLHQYPKSLARNYTKVVDPQGKLTVRHVLENVVFRDLSDAIEHGAFDPLISRFKGQVEVSPNALQAVEKRLRFVFNVRYLDFNKWKRRALVNCSGEKSGPVSEVASLLRMELEAFPGTARYTVDQTSSSSLTFEKTVLGDSIEISFADLLWEGCFDAFLFRFGSLPFQFDKEMVFLVNIRLKHIRLEARKKSQGWDQYRVKSTFESQLRDECRSKKDWNLKSASIYCMWIDQYLDHDSRGDPYLLLGKFHEYAIGFSKQAKTYNRLSVADQLKLPAYPSIVNPTLPCLVLFQPALLAEASSCFDQTSQQVYQDTVRLAYMFKLARKFRLTTCVFTGAGIGTGKGANLPTVRGDTKAAIGDKASFDPKILEDARPTVSHMVIKAMVDNKYVHFVCSQNIENLHRSSGLTPPILWEVHGNIFDFQCSNCRTVFDGDNAELPDDMLCPVCSKGKKDDMTALLENKGSLTAMQVRTIKNGGKFTRHSGTLRRKVVRHYGENISPPEHAKEVIAKMKCCLVVGSSLRVGKIAHFVCPPHEADRPLLGIINIGPSKPKPDTWATEKGVRIDAKCDTIFKALAILLELDYDRDPPQCNRKILRERGETSLDLERIFFGERKVPVAR